MNTSDLLSARDAKAIEYVLAVGYLLLFVPFWRFVNGRTSAAAAPAGAALRRVAGWFTVPDGLRIHPGHAWARRDADGLVSVGMDDFARRLVGPLDALELPSIGTTVRQGEPAPRLVCGAKSVALLSPIEGRVVAVNQDALEAPEIVTDDPYGRGWLFKVRPERWRTDRHQLLSGVLARRFMEGVAETLRGEWSPSPVLQDGGQPVDGIAHELYGERWDEFARRYLLS